MVNENNIFEYIEQFNFKRIKADIEFKRISFFDQYGFKREKLTKSDDYELTKNDQFVNNKELGQLFTLLKRFRFSNDETNEIYNKVIKRNRL